MINLIYNNNSLITLINYINNKLINNNLLI